MHRSAFFTVLLLASCEKHGPAGPAAAVLPAIAVRTHTVALLPVQGMEEVVGTVRSRQRAIVEAKISGRILEYLAVPGTAVKEGDMLAKLDP